MTAIDDSLPCEEINCALLCADQCLAICLSNFGQFMYMSKPVAKSFF